MTGQLAAPIGSRTPWPATTLWQPYPQCHDLVTGATQGLGDQGGPPLVGNAIHAGIPAGSVEPCLPTRPPATPVGRCASDS
jgi:hypothetical protein